MDKKIKVEELQEGMVVNKSVFDNNYKLLIAKGFKLENTHIKLLMAKGIKEIQINVGCPENIEAKTIISNVVKKELVDVVSKSTKDIKQILTGAKDKKNDISEIINENKCHIDTIIKNSGASRIVNKIVDDILSEPWAIINLDKIKQSEVDVYSHVLNVTVISICIGYKLRFGIEELKELGLCALNYDIGMLAVPKDIINKDTELTEKEKELLLQHTVFGNMMLSEIQGIPPIAATVALCHHENQDGSGYPQGLRGDNRPPLKDIAKKGLINRFAEIIAVADAYDMFTSGRKHFSEKMSAEKAIKKIIDLRRTKFNVEIIKTLTSLVPIYPIGTQVRVLMSPQKELLGYYGVVAQTRSDKLFQPVIVLIESKQKKRLPKSLMVDFVKHKGFKLEMVV